MEVKGTAVRAIEDFVKNNFKGEYENWLNSMPVQSKQIFLGGAFSNQWYPVEDAAIIPTKKLSELFFEKDVKKGAWESGRYSAETALNGIYKIYIKLSSPGHIVDRASRVFSAYYSNSVMNVKNKTKNSVDVVIEEFATPSDTIEYRIGGWIECALELSGCKNVKVDISKSFTRGDNETLYNITWE